MKYTTVVIICLIAVFMTACSRKEETTEEKTARVASEAEQLKINETKSRVPNSEIIGKVQGREAYIHRFYDEKTGATCYFMDYYTNGISCVK